MFDIELYPRGFVFHPESASAIGVPTPEYARRTLPGGALLDLHSWADRDIVVNGEDWAAVIGIALLYDPDGGIVSTDALAQRILESARHPDDGPAAVEQLLYDMGGRYVVIVRVNGVTNVYHDAHGNRTVYWRTDLGVVASHYDILTRIGSPRPNKNPLAHLTLGGRWEQTDDERIRALLPNHRLEVERRREVRYFPLRANPFMGWSAQQRSMEISRIWHSQIEAVLKLQRPNVMSVTAGTDSRILMAFIKGREQEFEAFTYGPRENSPVRSRFTEILNRDVERSIVLAKAAGLNHRILRFDPDKSKLMDRRILERNSINNHGRWILPLYLENFSDPRTLFYRGNLVETARGHNYVAPGTDWRPTVERLLLAHSPKLLSEDDLEESRLATRLEMRRFESDVIPPDYRPEDMAYWEVRMGRFISEVSNETDAAFEVWMPINQRRILDLFMAYPLHDRYDEAALFEAIDREHPILNSFDLNDKPAMVRRAQLLEQEQNLASIAAGRAPDRAFHRDTEGTLRQMAIEDGPLQLDDQTFRQGSEVGRSWDFILERGRARIVLRSRWTSSQGHGYMEIEVGTGDRVVFHQDLADSSLPEVVDVPGLRRGDRVWVRLRALRTMAAGSWFDASRTEILSYTEER